MEALTLNKTDTRKLYKSLVKISLPIAFQSLISSSLNLIDTFMISKLGETALSAVGLSNQLYFFLHIMMFGFCSGAAAFIAQSFGDKNIKNVRRVTGFMLTVTGSISLILFVLGFFFTENILSLFTKDKAVIESGVVYLRVVVFSYCALGIQFPLVAALRSTHQTKLPMLTSSFALLLNTFLNYGLIYGNLGMPNLGIKGAAIATVIARVLEILILLYMIIVRKNILYGPIKEFIFFGKALGKRVFYTALPTTLNEGLWGIGMIVYAGFYGHMGTTEFAAFQASSSIHTLFILGIFSFGEGILILIGYEIGKGNLNLAYAKTIKILKISTITGLLSGLLLIMAAPFIVKLFTGFSLQGTTYILKILMIYGGFMWIKTFAGINITGTFRCGGDTKFALVLEAFSVWIIGVPLVYLGTVVWHLPIYMVVLIAQSEEVLKAMVSLKRLKSKKWLNNLIQHL